MDSRDIVRVRDFARGGQKSSPICKVELISSVFFPLLVDELNWCALVLMVELLTVFVLS